MSNFKEVVKESIEKGIILDSCGEVERFYDYGRYIDLCGLNPKDIVENMQNAGTGGGGSSKTNVVINGVVTEENGEYYVVLNATSVVLDMITISMNIDGKTQTVTMQPGSVEAKFGPVDKYCEITNVSVTPTSSQMAKYSVTVVNPNEKPTYTITWNNWDGTLLGTSIVVEGEIPTYTGETPTREADEEYTYTFEGWTPNVIAATGNATYTAQFNEVKKPTYTITWNNWDGTLLGTSTVVEGKTPTYTGETPTKESSVEFNYTFNGWSPSIKEATEDTTYTAEYSSEKRKYEIIFVNEDGTELLRTDVEYGTKPSYNGTTPTKESTEQYDYIFNGWDPEITEVKGTATYTAQYISQIRQYNITFIVENDEVIVPVKYGDIPKYPNGTPIKESTQQYDYTFSGWDPEITTVEGEKTYTANFDEILRSYTIRFLDLNGEVLQSGTTEYGSIPSYNGIEPTKEQTDEFTYTFKRWYPELSKVERDTDYTPLFNEEKRKYNIKFYNSNDEVVQDENLEYGTTPVGPIVEKESSVEYDYIFNGWEPEITTVKGDAEYRPKFKEETRKYNIKFVNEDGTVLQATDVPYGSTPTYTGETPTKEGNAEFSYKFTGWTPDITTVTGDATYTAQFEEITNTYTVKWFNSNGTLLETDTNVAYGTLPSYDGETPTIEKEHYICDFTGWDKPINEGITGDTTYTAIYSETPIQYELNVIVKNGQYEIEPQKETYTYNEEVTITIIPIEGYQYEELTDKIRITGDMTLTYECTPIKYDLTVNDSYKGQQPYGEDISEYLTFEPQEGKIHKWMEGNEEFTGNTMPNRDLVLIGVYEEMTENKMVYYGTDLLTNIENFTIEDVLNKNKQEYNGTEQEFIFNYSGASEDIVLEYEDTFDEALEEACQQYYYIAIPSNKTVTIINAAKQEITQYFTIKNEQFIIDNTNYDQYTYKMTGVNIYPETIKLKIIIK